MDNITSPTTWTTIDYNTTTTTSQWVYNLQSRIYEVNWFRCNTFEQLRDTCIIGNCLPGVAEISLHNETDDIKKICKRLMKKGILTEVIQEKVARGIPLDSFVDPWTGTVGQLLRTTSII